MVMIIIGEVSVVFHIANKNAHQEHGADLTGIKDIIAVMKHHHVQKSINPPQVLKPDGNNAKLNFKISHALIE